MRVAHYGVLLVVLLCFATSGEAMAQKRSKKLSRRDGRTRSSVIDETRPDRNARYEETVCRVINRTLPENERFFSDTNTSLVALLDVLLKCARNNVSSTYELIDDSTERALPLDSIHVKMTKLLEKGLCKSTKVGAASIGDCATAFEIIETMQFVPYSGEIIHKIERLGPVVPTEGKKRTGSSALFYIDYQDCKAFLDSARTILKDGASCTWSAYLDTLQFSTVIIPVSQPERMEFYAPDGKWRSKQRRRR